MVTQFMTRWQVHLGMVLALFAIFGMTAWAKAELNNDVDVPPLPVPVPPGEADTIPEVAMSVEEAMIEAVYLPLLITPPVCGLNEAETAVSQLATHHPNQGRITMTCDPTLAQVARARAQDMAQRNYFGHVNPDGYGPNYLVSQAGYNLPGWYGATQNSNNIESIAAGYATATDAFNAWLASTGHREHLLGESSFWADQTAFGIGYYYDPTSTYHHYWVFISAPPEN